MKLQLCGLVQVVIIGELCTPTAPVLILSWSSPALPDCHFVLASPPGHNCNKMAVWLRQLLVGGGRYMSNSSVVCRNTTVRSHTQIIRCIIIAPGHLLVRRQRARDDSEGYSASANVMEMAHRITSDCSIQLTHMPCKYIHKDHTSL